MQELIINKNDDGQRLDRFLLKYLSEAPRGFVFKMLRKKNIKLNGSKAKPEDLVYDGDKIQLYLGDDTIEKFKGKIDINKISMDLRVIYEDENIICVNKMAGILSHSSENNREKNIVDGIVNYLIAKGDYNPRLEHNFIPGICNRLDRNTSGVILGGKNYESMKNLNQSMREYRIARFYRTIVVGRLEEPIELVDYIVKDEKKNKVSLAASNVEGAKKIVTRIRPLKTNGDYTLLEIELITGRTHQIRVHLSSIGHPIIGDRKYGRAGINKIFRDKYSLEDQFLHGYRLEFLDPVGNLAYLKGREIIAESHGDMKKIEEDLFK